MALAAALACTTAGAAAPPAATCPAPGAPVDEAVLPADCSSCWTAPSATATGAAAHRARPGAAARWRLDWIRPAGDDAALSVAALPEAAQREARAAAAGMPPRATAARPGGWSLQVQSGPAWQGYIALQWQLGARPRAAAWPAGSTGWLALVEELPAGSEGNAQPRTLVRALAGPLPLAGRQGSTHMRAFRLPENAQPERLAARAWIESADGRILRMAADRCLAEPGRGVPAGERTP